MIRKMLARIKQLFVKQTEKPTTPAFTVLYDTLANLGYKIVDFDATKETILLDLGPGVSALAYLDDTKTIVRLEAVIVFEGRLLNLKTMASLANVALTYSCLVSGVMPNGNGKVKIYVAHDIQLALLNHLHFVEMPKLTEAIYVMLRYLNGRLDLSEKPSLDLSMFENIDVALFNPLILGERKEFIYGSWTNYIQHVLSSASNPDEVADTIKELKACAEFEKANDLCLADVGEVILEELVWNKQFTATADEDKTYVN